MNFTKFIKHLFEGKSDCYEFVSLGYNCLPRRIFTECGFIKTAQQGQVSFPFDLCVTHLSSLNRILQNNFKDLLQNIVFNDEAGLYHNAKYRIEYNHDKDCPNSSEGKEKIVSRYKKRIQNFQGIMQSDAHIFFVCNAFSPSENEFNKLYKNLKKLRKGKPFTLIVLDLDEKLDKKILRKKIVLIKEKHPFGALNDWWLPVNLELFNVFRFKVAVKIERVLRKKRFMPIYYNSSLEDYKKSLKQ